MGVFKKFIGGIASECMQMQSADNSYSFDRVGTISFKATDGTAHNNFYHRPDNISAAADKAKMFNGMFPYMGLKAVAVADTLEDYSLNEYSYSSIGTVTLGKTLSRTSTSASVVYNVAIQNSSDSNIAVGCIKFYKEVYVDSWSGKNVLICAYYLDSPLTIPAGESRTITIEMKVGTDVSVNET